MTRKAVVAGQFYSGTRARLEEELTTLMKSGVKKRPAIAIVAPHAGYIYSGGVAGKVYASIEPKPTAIILGPNHTGYGEQFSLMSNESWMTPLGEVAVDKRLSKEILQTSALLKEDKTAHMYEHSLEVQVPFLQKLNPNIKIVPICISHADITSFVAIGKGIAKAIKSLKKDCLIVASSDMTHYESHDSAKSKDSKAIEAILKLDETELVGRVQKYGITMCGYAPVACMLAASKELGGRKAELIEYQTSGEVSGDYSSVVGYAGIIIN